MKSTSAILTGVATAAALLLLCAALTGCGPVLWRVIPHATPLL